MRLYAGRLVRSGFLITVLASGMAWAQQPAVAPGPGEPDWPDLLKEQWRLDMLHDLRNPVMEGVAPAALFQRARAERPVTFRPIIALGVETTTRGGWYVAGPRADGFPDHVATAKIELWAYAHKQTAEEMQTGRYAPPPLTSGDVEFDPGSEVFGLWISNDQFDDGGVFTQPAAVARVNARLRAQPYKAMIYPNVDPETGRAIMDSYLIGWEYSTNDDFQDVVTRIDNVRLLPAHPALKGIVEPDAEVRRLATGYRFTEGPAWDPRGEALYFSDIPPGLIIRYAGGRAEVANDQSRQSNGLMFDRDGLLLACEHAGRQVSRARPGESGETIVSHYRDRKLNSPNDLWIDETGGFYFTDPRYGPRDDLEQDKEAVYYVSRDGEIRRIIDDLVRPNGIGISIDGRVLYVIDHGANSLHRYPITAPGSIGDGRRIAHVTDPDGMTIDREGRLYIAGREGVSVLTPDGRWLGVIGFPEQPANCTFGGTDWQTLFVTARTSLYAIDTRTRGWHVHLDGKPAR